MLLPENPEKRLGLWESLTTQLAQDAMCFIVEEGLGNPLAEAKEPSRTLADLVVSRLRVAPICRISANRGKTVAPHFAGQQKGDTVQLIEFLTYSSEGAVTVDNEKLKRDLETAVINLLFAEGGVSTVQVPLCLPPWDMRDAEISLVPEGMVFKKRL